MKRFTIIIVIMALIIAMLNGCTTNATDDKNIPVLGINDIRFDPLSFTGELALTGINVGLYPPDPTIFFLMDTDELLACLNMQCGAFQLPVIYTGKDPMPELADEVIITGSWVEYEENGQSITIFGATKIKVKRNVMSILMGG